MSQRKKNWDDIRNRMQTEMETFSKEAGQGGETLADQLRAQNEPPMITGNFCGSSLF